MIKNVVFENVLTKKDIARYKSGDVCFFTGVDRSESRDGFCAEIAIKCGKYDSRLDFFDSV